VGETYNIGGQSEKRNIDVVRSVCDLLAEARPGSYAERIQFVKDRPGHDRRYAIDGSKLAGELGWQAKESFESALRKTVLWYLDHADWVEEVTSGAYRNWVETNYARRGAA
jgi:dTDP-glucose 4,6-dehydratase